MLFDALGDRDMQNQPVNLCNSEVCFKFYITFTPIKHKRMSNGSDENLRTFLNEPKQG